MSAMRHRMNKAMSAMRAEMYFYKNPCVLERRKHEKYKQAVQASLHTRETWSWTKELADTLHGFESTMPGNDTHKEMEEASKCH